MSGVGLPPWYFFGLRRPNPLVDGNLQGGPSRLVPHSCGEPLPIHTSSTGNPPTLAGSFGSVSCVCVYGGGGGHSFPLSLDVHKYLFVPCKTGVCFPGNHCCRTEQEKRMKRNEDSLRDLWDYIKHTNIRTVGVPEKMRKKKDLRKYLKR